MRTLHDMDTELGTRRAEVLVVSPTFYPEKVGTPHYVADIVRVLDESGFRVRVVTNQPYYPTFERFPGYGRNTRSDSFGAVPVHRLPTIVPREGRPIARVASEVNMLLQVAVGRLARRLPSSDHVVAVSPGVPFSVLAGRLLCRGPSQLTAIVHDIVFGLARTTGGRFVRALGGAIRRLEVACLNRADRLLVLSEAMGEALHSAGVTCPIETIPLWPTVSPVPDDGKWPGRMVQYSGNLGRKQGVHVLLDLADELAAIDPAANVVIRGDGPEREALASEAVRRRLRNVVFEDFVPSRRLVEGLVEGRVHVVPQLPEGAKFAVPSKVVNILAVGRPVVVTAERGTPLGLLAEDCDAVFRVDPGDVVSLAKEVAAVLALDDDDYEEVAAAARNWACRRDRDASVRRIIAR